MAKKWTPSRRQLELYDELLRKKNITRKRLLKRQRIIEEERGSRGTIPDLVLPKHTRRSRNLNYSFSSFKEYQKKLAELRHFKEEDISFIRDFYKHNILDLITQWITQALEQSGKPPLNVDERGNIKREGGFGRFSKEQISDQSDKTVAGYMELYNKLQQMSPNEFYNFYMGFMPLMKYIYQEVTSKQEGSTFSALELTNDGLSRFRSAIKTGKLTKFDVASYTRFTVKYKKYKKNESRR